MLHCNNHAQDARNCSTIHNSSSMNENQFLYLYDVHIYEFGILRLTGTLNLNFSNFLYFAMYSELPTQLYIINNSTIQLNSVIPSCGFTSSVIIIIIIMLPNASVYVYLFQFMLFQSIENGYKYPVMQSIQ